MDKNLHKILWHGTLELISLARRGAGKLKDKYIWTKHEVEEAKGYLIYFRDLIKQENITLFYEIFGENGDLFEVEPFARGYNAKVLSFKTIVDGKVKKWVIKVGFQYALIEYNGDPSNDGYPKEYQAYLDTLRQCVAKYPELKHLLPEPQTVTWASLTTEDEKKGLPADRQGTTLAIQPFMHVVKSRELKRTLTRDEKKQLLRELKAFKRLSSFLVQHHQVAPELVGEGNLEIVKLGNEYHLMLLDMGWVDLKKILPITHTVAHFSAQYVVGKLEGWLKSRVSR